MPKSFHNSRIGPWDDRSAVFVGAEQVVVGVVEREQRRPCRQAQFHGGVKAVAPGADVHPAAGFGSEDRLEQQRCHRERVADVVVATHDGGDRRELRRAAVVEGVGVDGEQRADPIKRADRHRSGHDRGNVAVERRDAGGNGMPIGPLLQPSIEFVERHGGRR